MTHGHTSFTTRLAFGGALALALAAILTACTPAAARGAAAGTTGTPAPATGTPLPPAVSAAPTATHEPSATATNTPTPTPTPLNPLTIEWLRQRTYPGSPITIEQKLDPGANYQRYIASYQSDGLKIYGLLTVPNGQRPATGWPVIIFNHGYIPPQQYVTTERYVAYVDAIARSGYIVFKPDYRGHGNSQGQATGAYGSPDYVVDVLNAVASMKQYPDADPNRIGMWGHSMGGYITLRVMVVDKDIRAGVIWSGVVGSYADMLENWRHPTPIPTTAPPAGATPEGTPEPGPRGWRSLIDQYGTPEQNPAFWASISANSYLADLSGPLQLHATTTDEDVPYQFSQTLASEVQAAGKSVDFYTYEGDNHNLSVNFSIAMQRTIEFFDKYVKGPG